MSALPSSRVPAASAHSARQAAPLAVARPQAQPGLHAARRRRQWHTCRAEDPKRSDGATMETSTGLKAVWYAAELFGKALGKPPAANEPAGQAQGKILSRDEIVSAIKSDYDQNYFVSGAADMDAYAEDCVYADPFVSFKGTKRFKENVSNFASLLKDVRIDVYDITEPTPDTLKTRWRFSCVLDLPWKPRLAAAGNTTHVIDLTQGKVVKHIEVWETEPDKVIKQLFRPANKIPSNAWETFFLSASEGDAAGVWLASTPVLTIATAPVVLASLGTKIITGEGFQGVALGALEGISWLLFVSALVTEVYKLVKSAVGGEGM